MDRATGERGRTITIGTVQLGLKQFFYYEICKQEIVNIKCSEVLASETFAIVVLRKEFSFKILRDLGKS